MKISLTVSLGLFFVIAGPSLAQKNAPKLVPSEYYPLTVGQRFIYRVNGDLKKEVAIEVERVEKYVRKELKDGKVIEDEFVGHILKSSSGDKVTRDHVVVTEKGVLRVTLADSPIDPPLVFFKFGAQKLGETWEWNSSSGNSTVKGTCTIQSDVVQVPYKGEEKLPAVAVWFSNNKIGMDRHEIKYWFVKDIGMVKQHVRAKNHDITLELIAIKAAK